MAKIMINLIIRRYDLADEKEEPPIKETTLVLEKGMNYKEVKTIVENICEKDPGDERKVIKIRRRDDNILIPYLSLLDDNEPFRNIVIDVCNICSKKNENSPVQQVHLEILDRRIKSLEEHIKRAESLLPELNYKKQAHTEDVVDRLLTKMIFLNRRIDEINSKSKPLLDEAAAF